MGWSASARKRGPGAHQLDCRHARAHDAQALAAVALEVAAADAQLLCVEGVRQAAWRMEQVSGGEASRQGVHVRWRDGLGAPVPGRAGHTGTGDE